MISPVNTGSARFGLEVLRHGCPTARSFGLSAKTALHFVCVGGPPRVGARADAFSYCRSSSRSGTTNYAEITNSANRSESNGVAVVVCCLARSESSARRARKALVRRT